MIVAHYDYVSEMAMGGNEKRLREWYLVYNVTHFLFDCTSARALARQKHVLFVKY